MEAEFDFLGRGRPDTRLKRALCVRDGTRCSVKPACGRGLAVASLPMSAKLCSARRWRERECEIRKH